MELLAAAQKQPRAGSAALRRAHALRNILIKTFTGVSLINSGAASAAAGAMSPTLWADLRRFVAQAQAHAELAPADHAYELAWPLTARLDALLWPIALAALELLTSPQLIRVKKCAGCPWVFLDQSKNLSRRWYDMDDCGTHEKIRRYVSRRAAKKQSERRS